MVSSRLGAIVKFLSIIYLVLDINVSFSLNSAIVGTIIGLEIDAIVEFQ